MRLPLLGSLDPVSAGRRDMELCTPMMDTSTSSEAGLAAAAGKKNCPLLLLDLCMLNFCSDKFKSETQILC